MATTPPHSAPPAGPGTPAAIRRLWLLPGLLVILAAALGVRGHGLGDRGLVDAERAAMDRAGASGLAVSAPVGEGVAEDLARALRTLDGHGAAARIATRFALRSGHGEVVGLRADGVLAGSLAALLLAWLLIAGARREPLVALTGAGLVAVQLASVHGARLGTGAMTAATLWFAALGVARWMQLRAGERERGRLVVGALGVGLLSSLAVLFDPSSAHSAWVLIGAGLLLFRTGPNGVARLPWRSWRVAAIVAAAVPSLVIARSSGIESVGLVGPGPLSLARALGLPVLALAAIGVAGAFTRDAGWALWLALWAVVAPVLTHGLGLLDAHPAALALPALFLAALAAEGAGLLWGVARERWTVAAADVVAIGAVLWLATETWSTLHGSGPWSVALN